MCKLRVPIRGVIWYGVAGPAGRKLEGRIGRMHRIVMYMGGLVAAMGALFFVMLVVVSLQGRDAGSMLFAALIGGGLILSGAILCCFGAIVEHLIAIRANTERQLEIFGKLGRPRDDGR